jgi:hypothetical protein
VTNVKRRGWTEQEIAIVREFYPHKRTSDIAEQLGRTVCSVYNCAHFTLGLHKTAEFLASVDACRLRRGDNIGAAFRFRKGQTPPNKGVRRPGYAPGRMKETQFKKGQNGWNWRPVGSQRLVDGYLYTKISDTRYVPWTQTWKPTHVLLWEKHNGRVPRGHVLVFINGDRTQIRLENLKLISRADLCRRNSIHNLPPELKGAILTLGQLKRRIRREEQDRRSA